MKISTHHGRPLFLASASSHVKMSYGIICSICEVVPDISVVDDIIISQADISSTIAASFSVVCSSENYDSHFRVIKDSTETFSLSFTPFLTEACNTTFSMDEFLAALEHCCNMSPGPNGTHNKMLPPIGREFLLSIYTSVYGQNARYQMPREKILYNPCFET
jgi:hypothetical protein